MAIVFNRLALFLSIAALALAEKDQPAFKAAPAASYAAHQTNAKVTIGADVITNDEKAKPAFGKNNPYNRGVLPILVVIQNDSPKALRAERLKVEYLGPTGSRVAATPASEVKYLQGPRKPKMLPGPTGPKVLKGKNPLAAWEIEGRAFAARMIPAGESASGFFYFETRHQPGARLYLTGLSEADTGTELFYFEIPLE